MSRMWVCDFGKDQSKRGKMPIEFMVTISEEIQEKMKGLYHRYQQLQRDGSVSMLDVEKQTLLDIHKALFKTNFCTTCQDAILFALAACFRNYHLEVVHTEEFNEKDVEVYENPKYAFSGTNKQWKEIKKAYPDYKKEELPECSDIVHVFKDYFKEV